MKLEEIKKLSDEEIEIQLAELTDIYNGGKWQVLTKDGNGVVFTPHSHIHISKQKELCEEFIAEQKQKDWIYANASAEYSKNVPAFCRDLNAIAEVEKIVIEKKSGCKIFLSYSDCLRFVLHGHYTGHNEWNCTETATASARIRAEACLLTLGGETE